MKTKLCIGLLAVGISGCGSAGVDEDGLEPIRQVTTLQQPLTEFDSSTTNFTSGVMLTNDLFSNRALRAYFPGFGTEGTGLAGGSTDIVFLPAGDYSTLQAAVASGHRVRMLWTQPDGADPSLFDVHWQVL